MEIKTKTLCGESVKVAVYGGMCRLSLDSTVCVASESPESIEKTLAEKGISASVTVFRDGSVNIRRQKLVKWDTAESEIEALCSEMDNELETALGLNVGESVTSGSWNFGHNDQLCDNLMTESERQTINK